jgi:hypothetical protein
MKKDLIYISYTVQKKRKERKAESFAKPVKQKNKKEVIK